MPDVIFAMPFAMEGTMRFVRAVLSLPDTRLGLIAQDPAEKLPEDVRARLHGFARIEDAMDERLLLDGVRRLARRMGSCDRLLGILEPLQEPLAAVREELRIPGMDRRTARNFRDKARMKDVLRANGLPCARHLLCPKGAEALERAAAIGFPLVLKPKEGAGARSTVRCETRAELESLVRSDPGLANAECVLEEFVRGDEFSFDSIALGGRHLFASIGAYRPTPLHVLENPWIQWAVVLPRRIDGPEFRPIHEAGPRALAALGMVTGMTHMEWFRREDGSIAIGEVAARPPGAQFTSLIGYAHDSDMYRAWAEVVVFDRFVPPERVASVGAAYLRGQGTGRVKAVHGLSEVRREVGPLVVEAKLPRRGQPASGGYEGDGYVIVRHSETDVVERALARIVSALRVELE